MTPDVIKTFVRFKILTERELHARYEVNLETYCKTINVEAQLMVLMADRYILPAALEYQRRVADSVAAVKAAGGASKECRKLLDRIVKAVDQFRAQTDRLAASLDHASPSTEKHAKYCATRSCRRWRGYAEVGDRLELMLPHELWPLPTYREMLFIK